MNTTVQARPILNRHTMEEMAEAVMISVAISERLKAQEGESKLLAMAVSALLTGVCILMREELLSRDAMEEFISMQHGKMGLEVFDKSIKSYNKIMNAAAVNEGHYYEVAK